MISLPANPNGQRVAQDLEPEYIAVSYDSKTAWVMLQEHNAIGKLDIERGKFTKLFGLGFKDHTYPAVGDLAAEIIHFISSQDSPGKKPCLPSPTRSASLRRFMKLSKHGSLKRDDEQWERLKLNMLVHNRLDFWSVEFNEN